MRRIIPAIFISAMVVSLTASSKKAGAAGGFDWPQWRGPDRNGTSVETGWNPRALSEGAAVLWKVDLNLGYSSVGIMDDRVYAMGRTKESPSKLALYCLDAATGKKLWQSLFPLRGTPQSTPAIDGDCVYGLNGDGTLLCLKTRNGSVVWQKNLQSDFHAVQPGYEWSTSPIIEGDLLLLNGNSRALAIDKRDGKLVWAIEDAHQKWTKSDEDAHASVVVTDIQGVRCAVFDMPSMLRVVEVKTGNTVCSFPHEGGGAHPAREVGAFRDPIVCGGRVFDTDYSVLLEPTGNRCSVLWTSPVFFGSWSPPVLLDGYLYGSNWAFGTWTTSWEAHRFYDFSLLCVEWDTGEIVWRKELPYLSVMAADGKLIALELNGTLHIAEVTPSGYAEISSADVLGGAKTPRTFATPPVLCNGRIYCRNYAGDLVCIDVST
jgi:outer membrane protein assembly factor BamB